MGWLWAEWYRLDKLRASCKDGTSTSCSIPTMNTKSLLITIVVAFITISVTDFLIHQVWLSAAYAETKHLWRPEAEMMAKMPLMMLGQLIFATVFSVIFASFVAEKRCLSTTLKFSFCLALISVAGQMMMYAVQPIPGSLIVKWCVAITAQVLLLGVVVHKVYRVPAK